MMVKPLGLYSYTYIQTNYEQKSETKNFNLYQLLKINIKHSL